MFLSALFLFGTSVEGGGHLDKPWFRWQDGIIPFTFQQMDPLDKQVVRSTMALIEDHTCLSLRPQALRFEERSFAPSGHRLVVRGAAKSCLKGPNGVPT